MLQQSPEKEAADALTLAVIGLCNGKRVDRIAAVASAQTVTTLAALQTIITLLVHKNIISEGELAAALKHHYEQQLERIENGPQTIITPQAAPLVRPS